MARRSTLYERGIDRLQGTWQGKGASGQDFARTNHLYQYDLNVLGEGSLFELICTTRSEAGAERLASYLLDTVALEESIARQEAVKELRDATALREQIALLGQYQFQDCGQNAFYDWLDAPILKVNPAVPLLPPALISLSLVLGFLALTGLIAWNEVVPWLLSFFILQAILGFALSTRIRPLLKKLRGLANEFVVLQQGLRLMERQHFSSKKLEALIEQVRSRNASLQVRKLERLIRMISQRDKDHFYLPSLLLAAGTQLALAVERWRGEHEGDLREWIDAWAEFDALNALACYAHEHPSDAFPELLQGETALEANDLGHPLLPENTCVRNEVILNSASRFYMVSGSNMAGKSTFLRAVGLNAILASAGAPLRSRNVRMSLFTVCASISLTDSLLEGRSKFLAEVERIRETLRCMRGNKPVLFLIDEILSGTNSRDRRAAAESVVRALIDGGAIGALSTHDLTLTELANSREFRGVNVHMESENPENPLDFDYRVKFGVSRRSNALAIVRMMGVEV